jgi:hypothetical protein
MARKSADGESHSRSAWLKFLSEERKRLHGYEDWQIREPLVRWAMERAESHGYLNGFATGGPAHLDDFEAMAKSNLRVFNQVYGNLVSPLGLILESLESDVAIASFNDKKRYQIKLALVFQAYAERWLAEGLPMAETTSNNILSTKRSLDRLFPHLTN